MLYYEKIKSIRKKLKLTQASAAKKSGISTALFTAVELGKLKPVDLTVISMIAKGLGVTVSYLFDRYEDCSEETIIRQELISLLENLNIIQIQQLINLARSLNHGNDRFKNSSAGDNS